MLPLDTETRLLDAYKRPLEVSLAKKNIFMFIWAAVSGGPKFSSEFHFSIPIYDGCTTLILLFCRPYFLTTYLSSLEYL